MAILMLMILVGFMATIVLASVKFGFDSPKKAVKAVHIGLLIVSILTAGLSFGYSIKATDDVVGDAAQVGIIEPIRNADSGNVYHDAELDKYFVIQSDAWNPIEPVYRTYLDKESAQRYSDAYKSLVDALQENQ